MESGASGDTEDPWSLEAQVVQMYKRWSCTQLWWEVAELQYRLWEYNQELFDCRTQYGGCPPAEVARLQNNISDFESVVAFIALHSLRAR